MLPDPKQRNRWFVITKVWYNDFWFRTQEENGWTWDWIIARSGCWWDPKAEWWPMGGCITEGPDVSVEMHGIDPKTTTVVYVAYSMNSWWDIGGSDMWIREYLSDDPYIYDVYHAPRYKRWNQLWTPKNDWKNMGQRRWYPEGVQVKMATKSKKAKKATKAKKAPQA